MKILVTGGTGVIGAGLIPELLQRGHVVRLLSRGAQQDAQEFPLQVEPFAADVSQPETLRSAADDCEAVVHITGIVEERPPKITFERVNVLGTQHVLEEAERAGVKRFIFISSLGADRGTSEYHRSKLRAERIVGQSPLNWVILRTGNVYGPGDEVISLLMKLVRSLPAVPVVGWGEQPFQPIWFEDLALAIAQVIEKSTPERALLELAGREITTTRSVIERLRDVTDRAPAVVPVPTALVSVAARVAEKFDSLEDLLSRMGLTMPITSTKLQMLLEENVIENPDNNALTKTLGITPTPLDVGLMRLANELPELLPEEGVGRMEHKQFWADISHPACDATELMRRVRENITDVMPIEFSAEPGAPRQVQPGATLTGAIPGRGHIQVRAVEVADDRMTFATIEGHPLAGTVEFRVQPRSDEQLRFTIEIRARAANFFDWLAMRTVGRPMQSMNWRAVVLRVVDLSGSDTAGVETASEVLSEAAAEAAGDHMRELSAQSHRDQAWAR
jgi:uncharacterized protein YbjT (DUF2867 family)